MQGYRVFAYEDLSCTPSRLGSKLESRQFTDANEKIGPIKVAAESPLTFAILYGEARIAQNRECGFTASFTPHEGESYTVNFAVSNGALACGIGITDGAGHDVPFESPVSSCAETFAGKVRNGGAGLLNWKVKVISKP